MNSSTNISSDATPNGPTPWDLNTESIPAAPKVPYPNEAYDWEALHCKPVIHESCWVAPGAVVNGRVQLKRNATVWYGCVLRGDAEYIEVGEESNIQDGSLLHVDHGYPCIIGNRVTLGHHAIVHGAVVEDEAMIAIGAKVLSRCHIGKGALIAAGTIVLEGTFVPAHTLWAGCPAKQIKTLSAPQQERLAKTYRHYVNNGAACLIKFGREHIDAL